MINWIPKEPGDDSPGQYYIDEQGIEHYSPVGQQTDSWGYGPEEVYNENLGLGMEEFAPRPKPDVAGILAIAAAVAMLIYLWALHQEKKRIRREQLQAALEKRTDEFVKQQQKANPAFERKDVVFSSELSFFNFGKKKNPDVHLSARPAVT